MADVIIITVASAHEGLKALVEEYGEEFVYQRNTDPDAGPACAYVRGGEPSCLVGKFLANVGVPLERLERADYFGGDSARELLASLCDEGALQYEPRAGWMLSAAQNVQDSGCTWGEALKMAASYT